MRKASSGMFIATPTIWSTRIISKKDKGERGKKIMLTDNAKHKLTMILKKKTCQEAGNE